MNDIDKQKTLTWIAGLSELALQESRKGNTSPATRLGSDPTTQYYFHSVHCLKTITPDQWALNFPEQLAEIDSQRRYQEQQQSVMEATAKVATLEDENAEMKAMIAALDAKIESLIVAQQPKGRKPKAAPVTEPEPEDADAPAVPSGEGAEEAAEEA